jgi:hypothetical protein
MDTKQLVSFARQRASISAEQNVTALEHPPYSPDLSRLDFFLFPRLSVIEGRFAIAQDLIARAARALTELSKSEFQECFTN